jgi:Zn-dependent protease
MLPYSINIANYMDITFIFSIIILIFSVIAHEIAHGYAADVLGDPSPRLAGRLNLNPLNHLEPFGSVILPTISYLLGGFIFGWAKPVMINPYNLRNQRWGEAIVAIAGPLTNILIALIFGLLIRNAEILHLSENFIAISGTVVIINLVLATFNMIPVPPLDGSKVLFAFLPYSFMRIREYLETQGLIIMLLVLFFGGRLILPVVAVLFQLITGIHF